MVRHVCAEAIGRGVNRERARHQLFVPDFFRRLAGERHHRVLDVFKHIRSGGRKLARAHRWKGVFDSGRFSSIKELADAEQLADRYIGNLLRLTLLTPDIIGSILDGRLPSSIGLADFMKPWPALWAEQRTHLHGLGQG